jgi:hypothetical protein
VQSADRCLGYAWDLTGSQSCRNTNGDSGNAKTCFRGWRLSHWDSYGTSQLWGVMEVLLLPLVEHTDVAFVVVVAAAVVDRARS